MDEPPSYFSFDVYFVPDPAYPVVILIAVMLLLLAITSAAESAFFSLSLNDFEGLKRAKGHREKAMVSLLKDPRLLLMTFSIFNLLAKCTLITICIIACMSSAFGWSIKVAMAILTVCIIFIGDLVPRVVGKRFSFDIALTTARLWKLLIELAKPIAIPINNLTTPRRSSLAEKRADGLSQALALAAEVEGTSEGEKEILKGIANFGTLIVRQVMRTRAEISAINVNSTFAELMEYVNKSGFSRIPVYDSTIDSIIGVLYIKDLLPFLEDQEGFEWQSLLRPSFFVPGNKKIDLLLKEFQEKRVHMAIVIGEYGGTLGLVTLEDLIEEIIGEINDEFDEVENHFKKIDSSTYIFDGSTSLNEFCKTLGLDHKIFHKVKGTSESVAGLVLALSQKLPTVGDQVSHAQFLFSIETLDRKGIKRVKVKIHE